MKGILTTALLLLATPALMTSALAAPIHQFSDLALSPGGDKIAVVESDDPGNLADEPHGTVVVRDACGKITAHYDPCTARRHSNPVWSPKGHALAFLPAH